MKRTETWFDGLKDGCVARTIRCARNSPIGANPSTPNWVWRRAAGALEAAIVGYCRRTDRSLCRMRSPFAVLASRCGTTTRRSMSPCKKAFKNSV